jgi:ABC-type multidrug transport system fused ATPase/permease subunit
MGKLKKYLNFFPEDQKRKFFYAMAVLTVASILESIVTLLILPLIQGLMTPGEMSGYFMGLSSTAFVGVVVFMILLSLGIGVFSNYFLLNMSFGFGGRLTESAFENSMNGIYHRQIRNSSSDIVAMINNDVSRIVNGCLIPFFQLYSKALTAAILVISLFVVDYQTTTVVALVIGAFFLGFFSYVKERMVKNGFILTEKFIKINKFVNEGIQGLKEVKSFGLESYFSGVLKKEMNRYVLAQTENNFLSILPRIILESLVLIGVVCILIWKSEGLDLAKSVPQLAFFGLAAQKILPVFQTIFNSFTLLRSNIMSITSIDRLLNREHLEKMDEEKIVFASELSFKNVSFRYHQMGDEVLKSISVEIPTGRKVAIIGQSGSGKSTFLDLIMGLHEPDSGEVLVDGKIQRLVNHSWRSAIGYVPQNTFLLDASVRENIVLNREMDEERIWKLLEAIELADVVRALPQGLDQLLGERASSLSGGQRQRLGIARALYGNPKIVIFDEATSALDPQTETNLINNIYPFIQDKTVIVVAHRLSSIRYVDEIFLFSRGSLRDRCKYSEISKIGSEIKGFFDYENH